MATLGEWFTGTFGIAWLLFFLFSVVCWFTGVIAGFGAAWWMGIVCIFPIVGWFNGLVYIGTWGGTNLAAKVVAWIVASAVGVPFPFC